jgi:hypothetical protein
MTFDGFIQFLHANPNSLIVFAFLMFLTGVIFKYKNDFVHLDDAEVEKIAWDLQCILDKYTTDNIFHLKYTPYMKLDDRFSMRVEKCKYIFLIEYLFRKKYSFNLIYQDNPNMGKTKLIAKYDDLEKLAMDYIKLKKEYKVKDKLKNIESDF